MDGFSECLTPLAFLLVYSSVYSRVNTFFLATENKLQTLQTVHADRTIALILDDHVKYVINYPRPFLPRWQTNVNVNNYPQPLPSTKLPDLISRFLKLKR
jgi:hypothetical protein